MRRSIWRKRHCSVSTSCTSLPATRRAGSHRRKSSRRPRRPSSSSGRSSTSSTDWPPSSSSRRATSSSSCDRYARSSIARNRTRASSRSFARCTSRFSVTWSVPVGLDSTRSDGLFPLMPFRRFFERGTKRESADVDETPAESEVEDLEAALESDAAQGEDDADAEVEAGSPEDAEDIDWGARARAALPTGASTGSKRIEVLYGDAEATGPTHFVSANGCRVFVPSGQSIIDCTMALGAVALGYGESRVQQAAAEAILN